MRGSRFVSVYVFPKIKIPPGAFDLINYMVSSKLKSLVIILAFFALGIIAALLFKSSEEVSGASAKQEVNPLAKRPRNWAERKFAQSNGEVMSGNNKQLKAIMARLIKGELPKDWHAELSSILDVAKTNPERYESLILFFTRWAESDRDAAIKMAGKCGTLAYEVRKEILAQLAATDAKEALAYYEKNKESLVNHKSFMEEIAQNWAIESPEEAWSWCLSLDDKGLERDSALRAFLQGLQQSSPDQVRSYIDKLYKETGEVSNLIIKNWAKFDPAETERWILASDNKEFYLQAAIPGIAETNLKRAEELLAELSGSGKNFALHDIQRNLERSQGPDAALLWVSNQVPFEDLGRFLSPVSSWASRNPVSAREWIEALPASPARDTAIEQYAQGIPGPEFFDEAVEFVNTVENAPQREKTLQSTLEVWKMVYGEDFEKWKNKPGHSEELKSLLNNSPAS